MTLTEVIMSGIVFDFQLETEHGSTKVSVRLEVSL
jgi:hypothetical protein